MLATARLISALLLIDKGDIDSVEKPLALCAKPKVANYTYNKE